MADFSLEPNEELEHLFAKIADFDSVAPVMLNESAPILVQEVKTNLPAELKGYQAKVKATKPKKTKYKGWIVNINVTGTTPRSKDSLRNNELAAYWEYGSSKNPKTGFMRQSVRQSQDEIANKMAEVFERECSK